MERNINFRVLASLVKIFNGKKSNLITTGKDFRTTLHYS